MVSTQMVSPSFLLSRYSVIPLCLPVSASSSRTVKAFFRSSSSSSEEKLIPGMSSREYPSISRVTSFASMNLPSKSWM